MRSGWLRARRACRACAAGSPAGADSAGLTFVRLCGRTPLRQPFLWIFFFLFFSLPISAPSFFFSVPFSRRADATKLKEAELDALADADGAIDALLAAILSGPSSSSSSSSGSGSLPSAAEVPAKPPTVAAPAPKVVAVAAVPDAIASQGLLSLEALGEELFAFDKAFAGVENDLEPVAEGLECPVCWAPGLTERPPENAMKYLGAGLMPEEERALIESLRAQARGATGRSAAATAADDDDLTTGAGAARVPAGLPAFEDCADGEGRRVRARRAAEDDDEFAAVVRGSNFCPTPLYVGGPLVVPQADGPADYPYSPLSATLGAAAAGAATAPGARAWFHDRAASQPASVCDRSSATSSVALASPSPLPEPLARLTGLPTTSTTTTTCKPTTEVRRGTKRALLDHTVETPRESVAHSVASPPAVRHTLSVVSRGSSIPRFDTASPVPRSHAASVTQTAGLVTDFYEASAAATSSAMTSSATATPSAVDTCHDGAGLMMEPELECDDEDEGACPGSAMCERSQSGVQRCLPEASVRVLKEWLLSPEHFDFPWPTEDEKLQLAAAAGISLKQLGVWMTNARKRIWAPLRRKQGKPIINYGKARQAQQLHHGSHHHQHQHHAYASLSGKGVMMHGAGKALQHHGSVAPASRTAAPAAPAASAARSAGLHHHHHHPHAPAAHAHVHVHGVALPEAAPILAHLERAQLVLGSQKDAIISQLRLLESRELMLQSAQEALQSHRRAAAHAAAQAAAAFAAPSHAPVFTPSAAAPRASLMGGEGLPPFDDVFPSIDSAGAVLGVCGYGGMGW